jgi:hypothetical protein
MEWNDRRKAKKAAKTGAKLVEQYKQNKGRALHETGAFSGRTNGQDGGAQWNRPKASSQAESQAAKELNW